MLNLLELSCRNKRIRMGLTAFLTSTSNRAALLAKIIIMPEIFGVIDACTSVFAILFYVLLV